MGGIREGADSDGADAEASGLGPEAGRFFRNYNRIIAVAYGLLLLVLAAFFLHQLRLGMRQELALIEGHVERHHQFLEFVLRSASDQLETLRMAAGRAQPSDERNAARCAPSPETLQAAGLRESGGRFHRDALTERDGGGNVVGQGSLAGRDPRFYCDLASALALDSHLAAMAFHLPHAARTRFESTQGFQLISPWQPARELAAARRHDDPVWRLGQPAANPDRLKYWTAAYFGGHEFGLLVPLAAPVYDGPRFMGVLTIDMSLDYLHRINAGFGYALGQAAVLDRDGRVLAHPGLYVDPLAVQAPAPFAQAFAPEVLDGLGAALALPEGRAQTQAGMVLVRRGFEAAPWQLVYAVPESQLWRKLLAERGPEMAAMLAGLALLMAITYGISRREFVGPAARLVNHVIAESRLQPMDVPRVPPAWRPWFQAITRAFRESLELSLLRRELDIAARLQQSILPRHWPVDLRFTLWGTAVPARDVGGDFFDQFSLPGGRCAVVVADVSGKGLGAGLFAMVAKTLLRSIATQRDAPPGEVARQVNEGLCVDNDSAMFVSCFHGQYDPASGLLVYANAGHPPPLLVRAGGGCEWLPTTGGTAFGVAEGLAYAEQSVQLQPGDTVLLYTDGVTEAEDRQGEQFGLARLRALFEARPTPGSREAIDRVLGAVTAFAQGAPPADDITCMAIHCDRTGEPA